MTIDDVHTAALAKLREPFPAENISKRPQVNCGQCTQAAKANRGDTCNRHTRTTCRVCDQYITTGHMHLDYVGHAEATSRLLDVDPEWTWEPAATTPEGLPLFDNLGGLWIRLTVAGVTRLGYGSADGKTGPNAIKEAIGDGIRNAGMRFGLALDLWAKTDLHAAEREDEPATSPERPAQQQPESLPADHWETPQSAPPSPMVPSATSEQINEILAGLRMVRGITEESSMAAAMSAMVRRDITHPKQLTKAEANSILETLRAEEHAKQNAPAGPAPTEDRVTRPQMQMMQATFGEKGIRDATDKRAFASRIVGRTLESVNDLSKVEASRVIDALNTGEIPPSAQPPVARADAFTDLESIIANVNGPQSYMDAADAITEELAAGRINSNDADLLRERLNARVPQGVSA